MGRKLEIHLPAEFGQEHQVKLASSLHAVLDNLLDKEPTETNFILNRESRGLNIKLALKQGRLSEELSQELMSRLKEAAARYLRLIEYGWQVQVEAAA